jgi:hypothetical protein
MKSEVLTNYQEVLEGTLGAIAAHYVCASKESSKVIRDCSKQLDSMSVELRKTLVELDKKMVVQHDQSN